MISKTIKEWGIGIAATALLGTPVAMNYIRQSRNLKNLNPELTLLIERKDELSRAVNELNRNFAKTPSSKIDPEALRSATTNAEAILDLLKRVNENGGKWPLR